MFPLFGKNKPHIFLTKKKKKKKITAIGASEKVGSCKNLGYTLPFAVSRLKTIKLYKICFENKEFTLVLLMYSLIYSFIYMAVVSTPSTPSFPHPLSSSDPVSIHFLFQKIAVLQKVATKQNKTRHNRPGESPHVTTGQGNLIKEKEPREQAKASEIHPFPLLGIPKQVQVNTMTNTQRIWCSAMLAVNISVSPCES